MKKILLIMLVMLLTGNACAAVSVRLDDGAALLDDSGAVIVPLDVYQDIIPLGGELFAAVTDGGCALLNQHGKLLSEACDEIRACGDVLTICRDGLWGLLARDGSEIAAPAYTRLVPNGEGGFWALKTEADDADSDPLFLLDASGAEHKTGLMVRRLAGEGGCGLVAVQMSDGLWGYCDASGALCIPAEYESAGTFRAGLAPVALDGMLGAADVHGKMVVPPLYESLEISASGLAAAGITGEGVWIFNADGTELAAHPGAETFASVLGEGYVLYEPERTRVFDASGAERFTASGLAVFSEGLKDQIILADGAWGEECVSIAGTETFYQNLYPLGMAGERALYACMSVSASRYMNDALGEMQLAVDMDSARFGVADETGRLIVPMEYESLQYAGDDRLLAHIDGLWQLMDSAGNVLWSHGVRRSEAPSF